MRNRSLLQIVLLVLLSITGVVCAGALAFYTLEAILFLGFGLLIAILALFYLMQELFVLFEYLENKKPDADRLILKLIAGILVCPLGWIGLNISDSFSRLDCQQNCVNNDLFVRQLHTGRWAIFLLLVTNTVTYLLYSSLSEAAEEDDTSTV